MALRRVALVLVLVVLLVASLAGKMVRYNTHLGEGRDGAEAAVARDLTAQGYAAQGSVDLVNGGVVRALRFGAPGCARPMLVVVLSGSAEGDDLLHQFTAPDLYDTGFVYGGRETGSPPLIRFLTVETVRAIGRAMALPVAPAQPFLGVALPRDCDKKPDWPALW